LPSTYLCTDDYGFLSEHPCAYLLQLLCKFE